MASEEDAPAALPGLFPSFLLGLVTLALFLLWLDRLVVRSRLSGCVLPPGPARTPGIGFLHRINPAVPYLTLTQLVEKYGKVRRMSPMLRPVGRITLSTQVYSLWMGATPCVVIADADVMSKCLAKKAFSGRAPLELVQL